MTELPGHDVRMHAAREVSEWHLGDPSWAGLIVSAYLNPDSALEHLAREKEEQ